MIDIHKMSNGKNNIEQEYFKVKTKSTFALILTIVIVALVGIVLTILVAFLAGSMDTQLFDFKNINFANFIPVIIIGGFITAITVVIIALFASKNVFMKIRDYFLEDKKNGGN